MSSTESDKITGIIGRQMDLKFKFIEKSKLFWRKLQPWLPWLSLILGGLSAFSMSRGFASSFKLAIYFFAVLVFPHVIHKLKGGVWHWLGLLSAQISIQYILLYLIPFLILNRAWFTLFITSTLCFIIFWDPWWAKYSQRPWFFALQSLWGAALTVSYLYGIIFPNSVLYFFPVLSVSLILNLFFITKSFRYKAFKHPILIIFVVLFIAATQIFLPPVWRFPYLSVWITNPHFGFGQKEREQVYELPKEMDIEKFKSALNENQKVCCFSPVVAPRNFHTMLKHVWKIDGKIIDKVELPNVLGREDIETSYRTYSCKKNFPELKINSKVECLIFIEDSIFLNSTSFTVRGN